MADGQMKDAIHIWIFFGLPAWRLAQALLSLRDYFRRRREVHRMPPPSDDELEAIGSPIACGEERVAFRLVGDRFKG
jgi:hypothetical protein